MKLLFLLSLALPCFARQTAATNVIITSLPEQSGEGLVVKGGGLILHIAKDQPLALGQHIYVRGRLYPESLSLYAESAHVVQEAPIFWRLISKLRLEGEKAVLSSYKPEAAGLVLALAYGNKNFLSPRFIENAKSSGMSHFLALSGLHITLASGAAAALLGFLGLGKRWVLAAILPFSAAYLLAGGMGIPLQRAFIFHLLWACSQALRLNLNLHHIFALSLILMIRGLGEASFLMSFGAIAGILFLRGFWEELCLRLFGNFFGSIVSVSLAAGLAVLPFSIYYFGEFNRYFLLSNLIILPFAPFIVLACLGAAVFVHPLWQGIIGLAYSFLLKACTFVSHIPRSLVFIENKSIVTAVLVLSFFSFYIMIRGITLWRLKHVAGRVNQDLQHPR